MLMRVGALGGGGAVRAAGAAGAAGAVGILAGVIVLGAGVVVGLRASSAGRTVLVVSASCARFMGLAAIDAGVR